MDLMELEPPVLDVEVVQKRQSRASKAAVEQMVRSYLGGMAVLRPGTVLGRDDLRDRAAAELAEHVQCVTLCEAAGVPDALPAGASLQLHVHCLDARGAERDALGAAEGEEAAVDAWALPCEELHGLWESLVYDGDLKEQALRYAETALALGAAQVDVRQVAWSGVVLLHGAPGTGKTSLCRALAHKLAVRCAAQYPRARLLEVNAHGLFSKWFSESGKIVTRLFDRIEEIAEDPRMLICVLVDEVESLTHARRAALAGLEPSDSIRAVNAVLGALDRLRRRPNALVLATSNVTRAIDAAFLDRADLVRRVHPPGPAAAYGVLTGALTELMARGLVAPRDPLFALHVLQGAGFAESEGAAASLRLLGVARGAAARQLSARALRRLPFLALARWPRRAPPPSLLQFAGALRDALHQYLLDADELEADDEPQAAPAAPATATATALCNGH